jgi:toxin ParE1/3/4
MDELFSDAVTRLSTFAQLGRSGKFAGTRKVIVHENYRLVYEIALDEVWILALLHLSRLWPPAQN